MNSDTIYEYMSSVSFLTFGIRFLISLFSFLSSARSILRRNCSRLWLLLHNDAFEQRLLGVFLGSDGSPCRNSSCGFGWGGVGDVGLSCDSSFGGMRAKPLIKKYRSLLETLHFFTILLSPFPLFFLLFFTD
jgi:hypothetical protein